jgi:hypothetical protein
MKILLITLLALTMTVCSPPESKESISVAEIKDSIIPTDWKRINECGTEFYIPSNLKEKKVQPFDSCAKEYRGGNIRLELDALGGTAAPDSVYSRSGEYSNKSDFKLAKTIINEQQAEIITYTDFTAEGINYNAVLDFPQRNFTMWTYNTTQEDREKVLKIFDSVRFLKE